MEKIKCYPETGQKITAPFPVLICTCGHRMWSILAQSAQCPKCGMMMQAEENTAGYEGIGPEKGIYIKEEDSLEFAVNRGLHGASDEKQEFKEMVMEWFYSGNWIRTE